VVCADGQEEQSVYGKMRLYDSRMSDRLVVGVSERLIWSHEGEHVFAMTTILCGLVSLEGARMAVEGEELTVCKLPMLVPGVEIVLLDFGSRRACR
jgi:hypothetical protein